MPTFRNLRFLPSVTKIGRFTFFAKSRIPATSTTEDGAQLTLTHSRVHSDYEVRSAHSHFTDVKVLDG